MNNRPDLSNYLAHFTKSTKPLAHNDKTNATSKYKSMSAYERLESILKSGKIKASTLPWNSSQAVCFTECPWTSLLGHAKQYSSFAVAFAKPRVFAAGGAPAYYVRADHYDKQRWEDHTNTFVTPFWPEYRPPRLKDVKFLKGKTVDYTHEREWRVPHDFTFKLSQVEFIILGTYKDMAAFPKPLKDKIGREKFLIMEVYRTIEKLWPVHNL